MSQSKSLFQLAVIVSALGFFVDVYDLLLFAIVRKPSLTDLGLGPEQVLSEGEMLISIPNMVRKFKPEYTCRSMLKRKRY